MFIRSATGTRCLMLLIAIAAFAGCGGEEKPRTRDELFKAEQELPTLYFTAITGKRVIAPANKGVFTDLETGEVCWPAMVCRNPNCPGKSADGEPVLYISPDIGFVAKPDGGVTPGKPDPRTTPGTSGQCPKCLKVRNRNTESAQLKQQYINWGQRYVLPESAKIMEELAEERRKRDAFEDKTE